MKSMRHLKFTLVALLTLALISPAVFAISDPIQLKSGKISGAEVDKDVRVYKGIPFAAPPVGDLRFKPPQPPAHWDGVRAMDKFGPESLQGNGGGGARGAAGRGTAGRGATDGAAAAAPAPAARNMSEDCLYLNVWTPAKAATENLPVMVWIHGGAWTGGAGSNATYDSAGFARKGVVAVTINYRLGALGFFAHPLLSKESERGASGNYGLLDTIAALKWVQDNIAAFGGDPKNVTIFGESAGGASVYVLLASPLSKGLFHKAIAESAWVGDTNMSYLKKKTATMDSAEAIGEKAAKAAIGDGEVTLAALRAIPADQVNAKLRPFQVSATVDGYFLTEFPSDVFAKGNQLQVPLIAGTNSGEGLMFARATFDSVEAYREAKIKQLAGEGAENVLKVYPVASVDKIRDTEVDFVSDTLFVRATREMVRAMAKTPSKAFMYSFTRNSRTPGEKVSHAAELPYVFGHLGDQANETDKKLSEAMVTYWSNFAKNGDPNGAGVPVWPSFEMKTEQYQDLGDTIKPGANLHKERLDALDAFLVKRDGRIAAAK